MLNTFNAMIIHQASVTSEQNHSLATQDISMCDVPFVFL